MSTQIAPFSGLFLVSARFAGAAGSISATMSSPLQNLQVTAKVTLSVSWMPKKL
jgi:hypothetical protein